MVFGEKIVKVGIISDTHGNESLLKKVIEKNIHIDTWIHAGDGASECGRMKELFSDKKFFFVRGNCDSNPEVPHELHIFLDGVPFFITHGHREKVKNDFFELQWMAHHYKAQVTVFGHTHYQAQFINDQIFFINPGSLSTGYDYAILEVGDGKVGKIEFLKAEKDFFHIME